MIVGSNNPNHLLIVGYPLKKIILCTRLIDGKLGIENFLVSQPKCFYLGFVWRVLFRRILSF